MNREDLKGIGPRKCPDACTGERCVISTVGVCKHPLTTSDSGCGPVTVANRQEARKVIRINQIEGSEAPREPAAVRVAPKKAPRARKKASAGKRRKAAPAPTPEEKDVA